MKKRFKDNKIRRNFLKNTSNLQSTNGTKWNKIIVEMNMSEYVMEKISKAMLDRWSGMKKEEGKSKSNGTSCTRKNIINCII